MKLRSTGAHEPLQMGKIVATTRWRPSNQSEFDLSLVALWHLCACARLRAASRNLSTRVSQSEPTAVVCERVVVQQEQGKLHSGRHLHQSVAGGSSRAVGDSILQLAGAKCAFCLTSICLLFVLLLFSFWLQILRLARVAHAFCAPSLSPRMRVFM